LILKADFHWYDAVGKTAATEQAIFSHVTDND
jgi:hypothetical protein